MRIPDATERKALLGCLTVASFICLAPGDIVPAGILWTVTGVGYLIHLHLLRREGGGGSAPKAPAPAESSVEDEGEAADEAS